MGEQTVAIDMEGVAVETNPAPSSNPPRPRPYLRAQSAFLPGEEPRPLRGTLRSRPTSFPDSMCLEDLKRPVFVVEENIRSHSGDFRTTSQKSHRPPSYRTTNNNLVSSANSRLQPSNQQRQTRTAPRPTFNSQLFLSDPVISTRMCNCQCQCDRLGNNGKIPDGSPQPPSDEMTQEDLSWRRLHMSRAKLKATATTSELLAGFAMVAMVELQINEHTHVPEWLFILFSICTTVLVAVHIFALMISTYLLPNIDAVSKLHVRGVIAESPHERMRGFIELAWAFSTVLGLFLFLVEVAILCWVKFWDYSFTAAWAATIIVVPVLVVFVAFAVHFYHTLVVYKVKSANTDIKELEEIRLKLETASSQV